MLKTEHKVGSEWKLNPFINGHQEGAILVLEGVRAEAIDGVVIELYAKIKDRWEITISILC